MNKRLKYKGLFFKVLLLIIFYFLDFAMSSSGNISMKISLRSENIIPISNSISNKLSDIEDFEELEAGITRLMEKFDIKGASIAVAKNGRLVFAKGIGYADYEASEPVEPRHMFRVASVSKLITAITIIKMSELKLINLDDKVFGEDGILSDSIFLKYVDPRVEKITIRHLLDHSGGWSRRFGDHMFMTQHIAREMKTDPPVEVSDIIQFALSKRLHFEPGSLISYSNLGYSILGEVIENISGLDYKDYVRQLILYPLGIQEMRIGRNLECQRFDNEVKYYEQPNAFKVSSIYDINEMVPKTYGGNDIETLGAAGGWIASPSEILRLIVAIDGFSSFPDILSPESIELMTGARLPQSNAIGWTGCDTNDNWWRTGTFAGTSALVKRQNNDLSWAVFFNSSTYRGTTLSREINHRVQAALNRIENWPEHDLFYHFEALPFYPDIAELK